MNGNNILASLSYFSIFFAPLLCPIIIYLIAEEEVKYHAKQALWTHLIPYITVLIGLILSGGLGAGTMNGNIVGIALMGTFVITIIINIYYFIWNIVKGIKVLKNI